MSTFLLPAGRRGHEHLPSPAGEGGSEHLPSLPGDGGRRPDEGGGASDSCPLQRIGFSMAGPDFQIGKILLQACRQSLERKSLAGIMPRQHERNTARLVLPSRYESWFRRSAAVDSRPAALPPKNLPHCRRRSRHVELLDRLSRQTAIVRWIGTLLSGAWLRFSVNAGCQVPQRPLPRSSGSLRLARNGRISVSPSPSANC